MPDDWENLVIETGVDSLLQYLAEHKKASCGQICDEIGVEESRVKEWADGLAEENLIEKHHTLTSGLVLEYTEDNIRESEKKKNQIQSDLNRRSTQLRMKLEDEAKLDNERRRELIEEKDDLDDDEKDIAVEDTVERLQDIGGRLQKRIKSDNLDEETLELINEAQKLMQEVEKLVRKHLSAEQDAKLNEEMDEVVSDVREVMQIAKESDEYQEEEEQIRKEVKVLTKLEENIAKAKQRENEPGGLITKILPIEKEYQPTNIEDIREDEEGTQDEKSIGKLLRNVLPFEKQDDGKEDQSQQKNINDEEKVEKETPERDKDRNKETSEDNQDLKEEIEGKINVNEVPEETYQELVDENKVTEVMRKISLIKNPDYSALKRAEENNRNRADLVTYLEERIEDGR